MSFGANGFSVKPFLWLWYNRFFSKIWLLWPNSADFDKISEVFPYYQIVVPETQEIVQIHK
jgi:hypothetical protein